MFPFSCQKCACVFGHLQKYLFRLCCRKQKSQNCFCYHQKDKVKDDYSSIRFLEFLQIQLKSDYFGERAPPISEQSEPPLLGMDLMM